MPSALSCTSDPPYTDRQASGGDGHLETPGALLSIDSTTVVRQGKHCALYSVCLLMAMAREAVVPLGQKTGQVRDTGAG